MLRAIKIRLYPNKEQELKLNKVLGCYRFVYNQTLARKQQEYKENKKSLGLTDLSKYFHGELLKDENYAWLKEENTKIMKQSIRQMLSAYDKFFKKQSHATLVGVGYDFQLVDAVPVEKHDQRVHRIILPSQTIVI
jgi:putative transposase